VVLVDIRGLDTMGEVSVLVMAAVGVVALARVGRGPRRPAPAADDAAPVADDVADDAKEDA
jgi:multicomponent Na+:H+ antiporter subunit A